MSEAAASSRFQVRRLEGAAELSGWDDFVRRSPQANPFAMTAWLQASCAATGAAFEIRVASKGTEWIAGVPLASRRRLGQPFHFGLPLAAYNSWIYRATAGARSTSEHLDVTDALIAALGGRPRGLSHLLVPGIDDVRPWWWRGWSARPRYTYLLDTTAPLAVSDSVRRHLRKCREAGFTMSFDWDIARFWSVFDVTRQRQGFGLRLSPDDFRGLADALERAGLAWMATASTAAGEPAASQIVLSVPGTPAAFMWVAGAHAQHLASGVSSWIMVEIAAECGRRGHRTWDLCGADLPNVARFKGELGGALEHYFQIDAPRGAVERAWGLARTLASGLRGPR